MVLIQFGPDEQLEASGFTYEKSSIGTRDRGRQVWLVRPR